MVSLHFLFDYITVLLLFIILIVSFQMLMTFNKSFFKFDLVYNHELELVWSIIPFFLLSLICIPSISFLYSLDSCEFCGFIFKVVGFQWYWSYSFLLGSELFYSFDSYMSLDMVNMRLMDVDNSALVPVGVPIRALVSSNDVIHSWTVPSLGLKVDAIPGRINQTCFSFLKLGKFFGQCSEICGVNHSFMPICLEVVPSSFFMKLA